MNRKDSFYAHFNLADRMKFPVSEYILQRPFVFNLNSDLQHFKQADRKLIQHHLPKAIPDLEFSSDHQDVSHI